MSNGDLTAPNLWDKYWEENRQSHEQLRRQLFDKGASAEVRSPSKLFDNRIEKKRVSAPELAVIIGQSENTIWKWTYKKKIPSHKHGRSRRFVVSEVLAALKGERQ